MVHIFKHKVYLEDGCLEETWDEGQVHPTAVPKLIAKAFTLCMDGKHKIIKCCHYYKMHQSLYLGTDACACSNKYHCWFVAS